MFPNKFYKISCDSVHVFKIVMIYIYTLSWRMVESSLPVPEDNVTMFLAPPETLNEAKLV